MCAPEPLPNIRLLILIICHLKCTYTTFVCNVSLKIVNTLRISVLISGFVNYAEHLTQSLFSKWRQTSILGKINISPEMIEITHCFFRLQKDTCKFCTY